MAKSFPNIDKSGFRCGEYVGYSVGGKVWKITKANPNGSRAKWLAQTGRQFFYARTLGEISEKLSNLDDAPTVTNC
jgi:hypothetical protein